MIFRHSEWFISTIANQNVNKFTQNWIMLLCLSTLIDSTKFYSDFRVCTGKSLSEALIFASTKPQYDDRFFIELKVQYMKIPSWNLRTCCVQKLFHTFRSFFVHSMFSPCSAKRRASDKDLPVSCTPHVFTNFESSILYFSDVTEAGRKNNKPI